MPAYSTAMKNHLLIILLFVAGGSVAQETTYKNLYGRIFTNFHHSIDAPAKSAFEVKRAYLGYTHYIDEQFSAHINLDIGSPDDQSVYALLKRYAYFKNAYLQYRQQNLKIRFGLVDNFQFKMQENFWKHRYIYRSFMDEHDFGTSADLGATLSYRFSPQVSADVGLMNGEGYNSLQTDNTYLTEAAITYNPYKIITIRGFYSMIKKEVVEHTFALFAGATIGDHFTAGAELNYKKNMRFNSGRNALGYSLYGSYDFDDHWQLFGRFDKLTSNRLPQDDTPWNLSGDGSSVISGVQFKPVPEIALALNYQDWVPWATNVSSDAYIYLNLLYKL